MPTLMTPANYTQLPVVKGDVRYAYGSQEDQFGELFRPSTPAPDSGYPTVALLHGGCWRQAFGAEPMGQLARAIAQLGVAVWNLEYRRLDGAGGWPQTFEDISNGVDWLKVIAKDESLDLDKAAVAGHSAGGHLALWASARHRLPADSELANESPLPLRAAISLAGIGDLDDANLREICRGAPAQLMGGLADERPDRYASGSPRRLLPLGVPQFHICGTQDVLVPIDHVRGFVQHASEAGDDAWLTEVPDAGHFEIVIAGSSAWPTVEAVFRDVLVN